MNSDQNILLLCASSSDTKPLFSALSSEEGVRVFVTMSQSDAIRKLKKRLFDMAVVETQLDGGSGLAFLAEARRYLPNMLRVIVETVPIDIPLRELINDVAPSAIISGAEEVAKAIELLTIRRSSSQILTQLEEDRLLTDLSTALDEMMKTPHMALPILPEIAKQVEKLIHDERTTFPKIAEWVEREPSMSARILQVANSPIYATLERIRTLEQAIARLGVRETRHLLEGVITEQIFQTDDENMVQMMRELWLHSICTAYCNEKIAKTLRLSNSGDYFLMGLLHDIGKLLVLHLIESGRKTGFLRIPGITDRTIEKLAAKRHNDLGEQLVKAWSYPAIFQTVIRHHNDRRDPREHSEPLIVTRLSNWVTQRLGYSFASGSGQPFCEREISEALNMTTLAMGSIEDSLSETIERIKHSCFAEFRSRPKI